MPDASYIEGIAPDESNTIPAYDYNSGRTTFVECSAGQTCSTGDGRAAAGAIIAKGRIVTITGGVASGGGVLFLCDVCLDEDDGEREADTLADLKRARRL